MSLLVDVEHGAGLLPHDRVHTGPYLGGIGVMSFLNHPSYRWVACLKPACRWPSRVGPEQGHQHKRAREDASVDAGCRVEIT